MDTITIHTPPTCRRPRRIRRSLKPALRQVIRQTIDQMTPHTRERRAKRPLPTRATAKTGNGPAQKRHSAHNPTQQEQITTAGIAYRKVDISSDSEARDYVMSLGYLASPVVYAGPDNHFSGFRPDRIKTLSNGAIFTSGAKAVSA